MYLKYAVLVEHSDSAEILYVLEAIAFGWFYLHMFSNISTRVFVLPNLICLRVLYLSTPFLTFSAWMMSSRVCLESTLMEARSLVRACTEVYTNQ